MSWSSLLPELHQLVLDYLPGTDLGALAATNWSNYRLVTRQVRMRISKMAPEALGWFQPISTPGRTSWRSYYSFLSLIDPVYRVVCKERDIVRTLMASEDPVGKIMSDSSLWRGSTPPNDCYQITLIRIRAPLIISTDGCYLDITDSYLLELNLNTSPLEVGVTVFDYGMVTPLDCADREVLHDCVTSEPNTCNLEDPPVEIMNLNRAREWLEERFREGYYPDTRNFISLRDYISYDKVEKQYNWFVNYSYIEDEE